MLPTAGFAESTFWPRPGLRFIVVDDEPEIRHMLCEYLGRDNVTVDCCANAAELDAALDAGPADLIVLDVLIPGEDGISIARRLRAAGSVPIIMLTALDDVVDRLVGLEIGADDYLTKPFDLRELAARVRAVLRRATPVLPEHSPSSAIRGEHVAFGRAWFDLENRCLADGSGAKIAITATEFALLEIFARNPNSVLSRARLLDLDEGAGERCIDIRIARLRKKTEVDPAKPRVIRTVRNAGYIYVPPRNLA